MDLRGALLAALCFAVVGCGSGGGQGSSLATSTAPDSAEKFLKWSMDQHKALGSYHAQFKLKSGMMPSSADASMMPTMTIDLQAPNRFRIESGVQAMTQTVISDGHRIVTSGVAGLPPMLAVAPSSLASYSSGGGGSMFGGIAPMFAMFAGSDAYDVLVDTTKGKPTFGVSKQFDGAACREVSFNGSGYIGKCTVLIDEKTGMDYQWDCDMAPLLGAMGQTGAAHAPQGAMMLTFESAGVKVNPSIEASKFDVSNLPKAKPIEPSRMTSPAQSGSTASAETPQLKEGEAAPDFTVTDMSGKSISLASLKGKPVMIDFWATWCGPCKQTLPDTDKISKQFKNLTVLAISAEDKDTIQKFVTENHYQFRACMDQGGKTNTAYHVEGIPCFVFIDAQGKVAKTIVGSGQESQVQDALKKIGAS